MAQRNDNKYNKFSSLLRKLSPNSPKKKLLLFVIIFGVIAGGFYAYRSFAATSYTSVRVRDYGVSPSRSGGGQPNLTFYNGNSKYPTWTLWNETGGFRTSTTTDGYTICLWGRVINDSHGHVDATSNSRKVFSFRQDRSRDQSIACWSGNGRQQNISVKVNGIIEFTNIVYWRGGGK